MISPARFMFAEPVIDTQIKMSYLFCNGYFDYCEQTRRLSHACLAPNGENHSLLLCDERIFQSCRKHTAFRQLVTTLNCRLAHVDRGKWMPSSERQRGLQSARRTKNLLDFVERKRKRTSTTKAWIKALAKMGQGRRYRRQCGWLIILSSRCTCDACSNRMPMVRDLDRQFRTAGPVRRHQTERPTTMSDRAERLRGWLQV